MINPLDYRLIASMVANGMSAQQVADELDEDVTDVKHAASVGATQRTLND